MLRYPANEDVTLESYFGVFRYSRRAIQLVWSTHRGLTIALALFTVTAGVLPAAVAYVGKLIVDGVVSEIVTVQDGGSAEYSLVFAWVIVEGLLVAGLAGVQRAIGFCQALLRVLLSQRVNILILEKALTLDLAQFEDSEFYDKLNRARQEASSRPLSLVNRTFGLAQHGISLASFGGLLLQFSPWAVLILIAAGIPAFAAETAFSGERFRVFRRRSPERRMLLYLEMVLAREDHAKEVKLFSLGRELMSRYRNIFGVLYEEDRKLAIRRDGWGFALSLFGNVAFYSTYAWIAVSTIQGSISLGEMTMYLLVFKQGQSSVSSMLTSIGGMYEDNLYLSNLYEYLEEEIPQGNGISTTGPDPSAGLTFDNVSFTYPGGSHSAVRNVSFSIRPGQSVAIVGLNGSGKTTLIKLMAGLYPPDSGSIYYQGMELSQWNLAELRKSIGVIFQDFNRYQLPVGENIGVGDVGHLWEDERWIDAATKGKAAKFIDKLPEGYQTPLGRWFNKGQELSGGEWQRVALSRAFMRTGADILVLDEPTASMDSQTESEIFDDFQSLTADKIAILISHRFSTVRRAELIMVMDQGEIIERGSHGELLAMGGQYARLFELQARGYR